MQQPEWIIQKHWVKEAKYKKGYYYMLLLIWHSRTDKTNSIVTKSKLMAAWLRIGMETFWCDGNVLDLVLGVGYMCIYKCQNSSILTIDDHAFHYM